MHSVAATVGSLLSAPRPDGTCGLLLSHCSFPCQPLCVPKPQLLTIRLQEHSDNDHPTFV